MTPNIAKVTLTMILDKLLLITNRMCIFVSYLYTMKLLFLTLGLLALAVAGIAIKIWAKKDGKFAGTCASQNPMLNETGESCGFCGKTPDQFDSCAEPEHK